MITNKLNGKKYVGQTVQSLKKRFQRHCWKSSSKNSMAITSAISKYGKENFSMEILCTCLSQKELNEMEVFYVKVHDTLAPKGYNLVAGGGGSGIMSQITKDKISKANIGRKASLETRKKLSLSHKNQKVSKETRAKISLGRLGIKPSEKAIQKLINRSVKTYTLLSPFNEKIIVTNLSEFCRKHGLNIGNMCSVLSGKRNHNKGWKKYDGSYPNGSSG